MFKIDLFIANGIISRHQMHLGPAIIRWLPSLPFLPKLRPYFEEGVFIREPDLPPDERGQKILTERSA